VRWSCESEAMVGKEKNSNHLKCFISSFYRCLFIFSRFKLYLYVHRNKKKETNNNEIFRNPRDRFTLHFHQLLYFSIPIFAYRLHI